MAEYVYPALFHPNTDDGTFSISYPDLPGCVSEGKSLSNALYMAQYTLTLWLSYMRNKGETIPAASKMRDVATAPGEFVNLIRAVVRDKGDPPLDPISVQQWEDEWNHFVILR